MSAFTQLKRIPTLYYFQFEPELPELPTWPSSSQRLVQFDSPITRRHQKRLRQNETPGPAPPRPFEFLKLPGEVRNLIYEYALTIPGTVHLRPFFAYAEQDAEEGVYWERIWKGCIEEGRGIWSYEQRKSTNEPDSDDESSRNSDDDETHQEVNDEQDVERPEGLSTDSARFKKSPVSLWVTAALLQTCRGIYSEARDFLYSGNFYFRNCARLMDFTEQIGRASQSLRYIIIEHHEGKSSHVRPDLTGLKTVYIHYDFYVAYTVSPRIDPSDNEVFWAGVYNLFQSLCLWIYKRGNESNDCFEALRHIKPYCGPDAPHQDFCPVLFEEFLQCMALLVCDQLPPRWKTLHESFTMILEAAKRVMKDRGYPILGDEE